MKKTFTQLFFLFSVFFLGSSFVQMDNNIFKDISDAITVENWETVGKLFEEAVNENLEEAESFFWSEFADSKGQGCIIMAFKLGEYHKVKKNFDKAHLYFSELLRIEPENNDVLCANAEIAVLRGRENEALTLYEKVLSKDPQNLAANIFIGNFHYFQTDIQKRKLEKDYRNIKSPTKMQTATYRESLQDLLESGYAKAKTHLERVLTQFSSAEAKKTLDKIRLVEKESKR